MLLVSVTSSQADVLSSVPQGNVLGPLLCFMFIYDIPDTKLFADDGLLNRQYKNNMDIIQLEGDPMILEEWDEFPSRKVPSAPCTCMYQEKVPEDSYLQAIWPYS